MSTLPFPEQIPPSGQRHLALYSLCRTRARGALHFHSITTSVLQVQSNICHLLINPSTLSIVQYRLTLLGLAPSLPPLPGAAIDPYAKWVQSTARRAREQNRTGQGSTGHGRVQQAAACTQLALVAGSALHTQASKADRVPVGALCH